MSNIEQQFHAQIPLVNTNDYLKYNRDDLSLTLVKYDSSLFEAVFFQKNGICCPEQIRTSNPVRQASYFYGRYCARQVLEHFGHADFIVESGAFNQPIWPKGINGSITHSSTYAAAFATCRSNNLGIGIDVEKNISTSRRNTIEQKVLSATELKLMNSKDHKLNTNMIFTLMFSVKESFFKAAFSNANRYFGFDYLEILELDDQRYRVHALVKKQLSKNITKNRKVQFMFRLIGEDEILTYCEIDQ